MADSALADTVLDRLTTAYRAAADPERAAPMRAYMRDLFPFHGIPTPERRTLDRAVIAGLGRPAEADVREVARRCWTLSEREYQYFGADWLRRHAPGCSALLLPTVRELIVTKPWWDTVDALAGRVVGPLGAAHPSVRAEMDDWIADDDLWVVRTAILHQLTYGADTDEERLFAYCLRRAGHPDFFIRKAIGWALRQYARTSPHAVRGFVRAHRSELSPLSVREALKNIGEE